MDGVFAGWWWDMVATAVDLQLLSVGGQLTMAGRYEEAILDDCQ